MLSLVEYLHLPKIHIYTFCDDKAEMLAVCPYKLCWVLFFSIELYFSQFWDWFFLFFLLITVFNGFFPYLNGLSDDKVVLFPKNENASLV